MALGLSCATLAPVLLGACARDRSAESPLDANPSATAFPNAPPPQPPLQQPPQQPPQRLPPFQLIPRPSPSASATTSPTPPPTSTTTVLSAADTAELFRAQDACLSNCDQFACMRIAAAYRDGAGVPRDPLAGRRYAIHACLECGAPGVATVDQCPAFGIGGATTTKKK